MLQCAQCTAVKADGTKCDKVAKYPEEEPKFCGNHKYKLDGDKKPAPNSTSKEKEKPKLKDGVDFEDIIKDFFDNDPEKLVVLSETKDNGDVIIKVKMKSVEDQKDAEIAALKKQIEELKLAGGNTSKADGKKPVAVQ